MATDINQDHVMDDEFYVIYNEQGVPCGRTITIQEADAICDKNHLYQWDIKKTKKYQTLVVITISEVTFI